jgi:uncharacterized protein (TIGR00369 family)
MSDPDRSLPPYSQVPVNRYFGFRLLSRSSEGASVTMEIHPDHLQEEGVVQGGIISALADNAAVYAFLPDRGKDETMTSIEFKMNFLRSALPENGPLTAESRVIRRGRHVGVCEVDVAQAGKTVAKGIFTYLFRK